MITRALLAFPVLALLPPAQQGVHSPARPALESPTRVAADTGGALLVTDPVLGGVATVDPITLAVRSVFQVDGRPLAVGTHAGLVYVGNSSRHEVQIYSRKGTLLGVLGGAGTVVGKPSDLAIDPSAERLFVVDAEAKHVQVFDLSVPGGQLLHAIGAPGGEDWDFTNPTCVAVDPVAEEVYVTDYGDLSGRDPRVIIYGYDGAYHDRITGDSGTTPFYFSRPQGVALGTSGHVFIADAWSGEVVVMDRGTGQPVATLGTYGSGPGELKLPLDIVIHGPQADLLVTNNRPRRIERFAQGGQL